MHILQTQPGHLATPSWGTYVNARENMRYKEVKMVAKIFYSNIIDQTKRRKRDNKIKC